MKRPQLVSQGSLVRLLQAAEQAWRRKDFQENIELLERASRLAPANTGILMQLGRAHGLRYNYAAAGRYFERAIRLSPKKTEALANAGRSALDFANHELAEHYFQQALSQPDATAETCARLAELYERLHRIEEASRLIDRALQIDGNCALALLAKARLERQAGRLEAAERLLRTFLTAADRETKIRAYYEMGAIFDRQGRYDEAMKAFLEAKALLQSDAPPLLTQLQVIIAHLKEMRENLTAGMLQRWFNAGPALQPDRRLAFLGGHARSGTTLLEQVLDSHSDIISAEETTIFHDEVYAPLQHARPEGTPILEFLESAQIEALRRCRENYFRTTQLHLGRSLEHRLLIDKNPSMTILIPVFLRAFPEMKLLVALRDPRDVCLSCFMQAHLPIGTGSVSFLNLETTVEAYVRVMGIWRTLAPLARNPWLEVRYEDMVEDLGQVARRTLDFLGVPWDPSVLRFYEHAQKKRVRSPTYADVASPVFKRARGRWRNYQKFLEPYLDKLEPFVKAFGYE